MNFKDILDAERSGTLLGIKIKERTADIKCDTCIRGKMTQTSFPSKSNRKTEMLEIIHSDVCGPMRTTSIGKAKYFVTFIDDSTRWCEIRFLKSKNEVLACFREFKQLVENKKGKKVKFLQSDNGGEYLGKDFERYLKEHGIARRLSVAYNPEQNGVVERKNRIILDMGRCLLHHSRLSSGFWAEAVNTANYIRNRCPTKSLDGSTPYEAWTGNKLDIRYLREFDCKILCLDNDPAKGKLAPRSKEGIFLGYSQQSKGYRVWISEERKVVISRDVKFLEDRGNETSKGDASIPETSPEQSHEAYEIETDLTSKIHANRDKEIVPEDDDSGAIYSADEDLPEDMHDEARREETTTPKTKNNTNRTKGKTSEVIPRATRTG